MAPDVSVASCKDIIDAVKRLKEGLVKAGQPHEEVSQMRFWYRGHQRYDWALTPSGLRQPFASTPGMLQSMLNEFRAEATSIHATPPTHSDTREWAFLMRHYQAPTLLLDWTRSPLTALFFAVESMPETDDKDAAFWMLRPGVWNRMMMPESAQDQRDRLFEAYSMELDELFEGHFDRKRLPASSEVTGQVAAIEPVYNSTRMIAQQSVFTIHGPTSKPMEEQERYLWKWRIHAKSKPDLRQELHDLGVHLSTIFPDLDNLSRCIRARYGLGPARTLQAQDLDKRVREAPSSPSDITASGGEALPGRVAKPHEDTLYTKGDGQGTASSFVG